MDRAVIEQKLESLRRCVQRIEEKRPADVGELLKDADRQDIIALNLTRAVQLCVDIGAHILADLETKPPNTMGETFDKLAEAAVISMQVAQRLRKAVGFRNIAIHNYEAVDWRIVHSICHTRLDDFKAFARAVAERLLGDR